MILTPVGNKVVVKPIPPDKQTESGIIVSGSAQSTHLKGKVESVGSSKEVNVGDIVVFTEYTGQWTEVDAVEYIVLEVEDILAVVKE